jgi:hypothetical protein
MDKDRLIRALHKTFLDALENIGFLTMIAMLIGLGIALLSVLVWLGFWAIPALLVLSFCAVFFYNYTEL